MYIAYIINRRLKNKEKYFNQRHIDKKFKLKNNRYVYLKLNRRYASLIINSLILSRRVLYYRRMDQIPIDLFFDKNNFYEDIFDLTLSIEKLTEECKNNFYNWKEFIVYKR